MAALTAGVAGAQESDNHWWQFLALQLTLGPLVGALAGWSGGWLVEQASSRNWMSPILQRLSALSLAVLCYAFAEMVHGNGFIAAFVGGIFLGVRTPEIRERMRACFDRLGWKYSVQEKPCGTTHFLFSNRCLRDWLYVDS